MSLFFNNHLKDIVQQGEILVEEPMEKHTTFRVGGPAKYFVKPHTIDEIAEMIRYFRLIDREYYILGNGSNLLVSDKGYDGVIIQLYHNMSNIKIEGHRMICQGGAMLSKISATALQEGLTGLEFASGIPGTIGGAMVMNAGAYGGEMKNIVESVKVVTEDGSLLTLSNEEMEFGYRTSVCKKKSLVCVEVILKLQGGNIQSIKSRMEELRELRIMKQPLEFPSAGSTFKRPEGYFAGKLIMDAGLSGFCIGGAKVSEKHCGFVINTGKATAADVKDLIDEVRDKVYERFDVMLEPEVCMLGEF